MPPPLPPFVFPTLPSSWFIGHMSRALREMQLMIQSQRVDLVIETRDARMPLTSLNPAFESILNSAGGKGSGIAKRLIVYNKSDLAQECFQEPLRKALLEHGEQEVIFTDSTNDADVKRLLQTAMRMANRELEGPEDRISMLVAGMPNVGKSSLLNALRRVGVKKGKAASTSSMPGHTRRLSNVIKISEVPPTYIYDTPGIMVPYLGRGTKGKETALKLALTGGIKESLFEGDTVAEYLLWRLRSRCEMREEGYTEVDLLTSLALPLSTPLDQPHVFLRALALRLSAMKKGGEPDVDFAGRWLLQFFREGKMGRWTLDGLGRAGEAVDSDIQITETTKSRSDELSSKITPKISELDTIADRSIILNTPSLLPPLPPTLSYLSSLNPTISKSEQLDLVTSAVDSAISQYFQQQSSPETMSGHQLKKEAKAAQAKVRDVKRKGKEVANVPGKGISSARRRVYRRE